MIKYWNITDQISMRKETKMYFFFLKDHNYNVPKPCPRINYVLHWMFPEAIELWTCLSHCSPWWKETLVQSVFQATPGKGRSEPIWVMMPCSSLEESGVKDGQHSVAFVYIRGNLSDPVLHPEAPCLVASDSPSPPCYSSPGKNSHSGL